MPCHCSGILRIVLVLLCLQPLGWNMWGQGGSDLAVARYEALVMDVLEARLQSEVVLEENTVRIRTSPNRLVRALRDVVRASAPYYFEGELNEFRRFSDRVVDGVSSLNGMKLGQPPRGWSEGDWQYYKVERAIQDAMILIAMDVGVYANGFLTEGIEARSGLARDWRDLQGGSDPLRPEPIPDFGGGARDESNLDGLGAQQGEDGALRALEAAIQELILRVESLESGKPVSPSMPSGGGFPTPGVDGGWTPSSSAAFPSGLPASFSLQFPSGSAALGLSAEYGLNTLVEWMAARPELRVLVTGHSDATGNPHANMELSRRRAQVVRYYLLERGVSADRVTSAHFGESRPEWGGVFDRRVEIRLLMD